jgi:hypothetical protein
MSYASQDEQPSIFFLKEDTRQSILTVFDWSDEKRSHTIALASIGLNSNRRYRVSEVFDKKEFIQDPQAGSLVIDQPAHSVRMLKIVDAEEPASSPSVQIRQPGNGSAGETLRFFAQNQGSGAVISYNWDFGDGVQLDGADVTHAYTRAGDYEGHLTVTGLNGLNAKQVFSVHVSGEMPGTYNLPSKRRYQ